MQIITVLAAIVVLSFIAGFGWRTGSVAAREVGRILGRHRNTSKESQKAQSASEAP